MNSKVLKMNPIQTDTAPVPPSSGILSLLWVLLWEGEEAKKGMSKHPEKFELEALSLIRSCFDINPCLQLRYCLPLLESRSHSAAPLLPPELPSHRAQRWRWVSPAGPAPGLEHRALAATAGSPGEPELNIDQTPTCSKSVKRLLRFPSGIFHQKINYLHTVSFNRFPFSDENEFPWNMVSGSLLLLAAHMLRKQKLHLHSWTSPICPSGCPCPQRVHPSLQRCPCQPCRARSRGLLCQEPHLSFPSSSSCHSSHSSSAGYPGSSFRDTWRPLPGPRGAARQQERDLSQGARVTGQGELPPLWGSYKG